MDLLQYWKEERRIWRKQNKSYESLSLPKVTEEEAIADNDILPCSRPKWHCCSVCTEYKELEEHETVKQTFLWEELGFNCQTLCGKTGCYWGRLWKKRLRKVGVSWELWPLGKGSCVYKSIYSSEDLFLFKLLSSMLLILSVIEDVRSLYRAITLKCNQIIRNRTDT